MFDTKYKQKKKRLEKSRKYQSIYINSFYTIIMLKMGALLCCINIHKETTKKSEHCCEYQFYCNTFDCLSLHFFFLHRFFPFSKLYFYVYCFSTLCCVCISMTYKKIIEWGGAKDFDENNFQVSNRIGNHFYLSMFYLSPFKIGIVSRIFKRFARIGSP